jgi:hypothetical protein
MYLYFRNYSSQEYETFTVCLDSIWEEEEFFQDPKLINKGFIFCVWNVWKNIDSKKNCKNTFLFYQLANVSVWKIIVQLHVYKNL